MKNFSAILTCSFICILFWQCNKSSTETNPVPPTPAPVSFGMQSNRIDGVNNLSEYRNTNISPTIKITFKAPLQSSSIQQNVSFTNKSGTSIGFNAILENGDSTIVITPNAPLKYLTRHSISITTGLQSKSGGNLQNAINFSFLTKLDSTYKFPAITNEALLTLVQQQTFKYFWDFAHPNSGLARERNTSGDLVTSGGSGFGIMALPVAIERNFISRAQGLERMQKIVGFLKNTAQHFHGAFPHWLNGNTGVVIPFSTKDDGADLVETSFLVAGLLTARQYFNGNDAAETALRNDINTIWHRVEWNWFRKNNEDVLYWHWSPNYGWEMNHKIKGWNESLITYVLAASSPTHSIPKSVYDNGWASNGGMKNGNTYYGHTLPLGPAQGGPLFFSHYSFLGINPKDLTDTYANYWQQNTNHALINYSYVQSNPKNYFGYSDSVWGLTASDIQNGYTASSPTNDVGVIAPTAALSSFPYTPDQSMAALKFYYYVLGDKLWKEYGFVDAFSLHDQWFANSFLAIDQGPVIIMIENYRTGLIWDLFMSAPEVKTGMTNLGFQSPNL